MLQKQERKDEAGGIYVFKMASTERRKHALQASIEADGLYILSASCREEETDRVPDQEDKNEADADQRYGMRDSNSAVERYRI